MDIVVAITLFVLALLIGVEVIGKVPATLHTPLMSGANSIHGIVIAGVVIVAAHATSPLAWVFIFLAAVLGTMNVVGGYVVTDRMLEMFKSDKGKKKEEEAPSAPPEPSNEEKLLMEIRDLLSTYEFPGDDIPVIRYFPSSFPNQASSDEADWPIRFEE